MCASVFAWAKTDTRAPLERPRYLRGAYIMNHKKLLLTLTLCLCALLCMVVTASADEPHANHYSCGVVNCQNNDHGHTQVTEWKGWDGTSEIVYTEGTAYIYLTRDVTFDQIFQISSGNTLYLCLNGKKIEMQGENNVLAANSGSKLVLCDCQRNGSITHGVDNNGKKAEGGGVNVSGTFVMYSGTISDNMTGDYYYGAVTVNNGAVFKMYGGSISGNQCISTGGAGGVYVYGGTFEMYGGTITDNSNLWVLGNYSRFIRPGYKRIDHITNKEENLNKLLGSAYLSPDGKRIVLVYVNMMASQNSVRINIEGQKAAKDINVYRTSAKENLKHIKSSFSLDKLIAIPTKSVVTIVIDFEDAINTGISHIKADKAGSNDIYSIEGKLVRKHADSTEGLAKGIYIQNGKKFVIK